MKIKSSRDAFNVKTTIAYTWRDLISKLESLGYVIDPDFEEDPSDQVQMTKDGKVYAVDIHTVYSFRDDEIEPIEYDKNIESVESAKSVKSSDTVAAAYYDEFGYEDDDEDVYTDYDGDVSNIHESEYTWINDEFNSSGEEISIYEYVGDDYTKDQFVCVDSSVPPTEIDDDVIEWSGDSLEDAVMWAHGGEYTKLDTKTVLDSNGFSTEYTMYGYNGDDSSKSKFIFMFGDSDLYEPDEDYADWTCDTREEAIEWFNDYRGPGEDDDIYTATSIQASEYWYFTKHGVQPGSVPKGYNILDVVDTETGSYFLTDKVIPGDALVEFDIVEKVPENR